MDGGLKGMISDTHEAALQHLSSQLRDLGKGYDTSLPQLQSGLKYSDQVELHLNMGFVWNWKQIMLTVRSKLPKNGQQNISRHFWDWIRKSARTFCAHIRRIYLHHSQIYFIRWKLVQKMYEELNTCGKRCFNGFERFTEWKSVAKCLIVDQKTLASMLSINE